MADRKITDLTALTTPASADVLPIVDVSEAAAADKNKKITVGELFKGVPDGTAAAPAIAFESDDGNGIFLSTTDTVGIATNGSSRMTVSTTAVTSTLPVIVPDGTAAAPSVAFTGSGTDTGVYSPGVDQVAISTGGSNRLHIAADGKVGVGTTVPGSYESSANNLVVADSGNGGITIVTGASSYGSIYFADGTAAADKYRGVLEYNHSNNAMAFWTDANERARIDSSGRLGLGTSSPASQLDVVGNIRAVTSTTSATTVRIGNTGNNVFLGVESSTGGSNITGSTAYAGTITSNGPIQFSTVNGGSVQATLDGSGRLGIGTTSPGALLHAAGKIRFGSNATYYGEIDHDAASTGSNIYNSQDAGGHIFQVSGSEKARLTGSGRWLVGTSTSALEKLVIKADGGGIQINRNDSGSPTSGQALGSIGFKGIVSANSNAAGEVLIQAVADEDHSGSTAGSRLEFHTKFSGTGPGSNPTERMRITNGGYSKFTNSGTFQSTTTTRHEFSQSVSNAYNLLLHTSNGSYNSEAFTVNVARAATSLYAFAHFWSGGFADIEFNLRGDGNAFADGSWSGGGADYAEYFEWSDGNTTEEDRRGISVVLDGDKIREAVSGEEPIGVISGNPSVVGDAAWNKWNGKYLRDDYGTYIQEDYEVEDEDGNSVTQQRRKLNPDYDPDVEYINREDRPEWGCVGLMGKLRIRKGQVTGARWIKMRDISDSVEEWLVR